jgi:hypothetical protein
MWSGLLYKCVFYYFLIQMITPIFINALFWIQKMQSCLKEGWLWTNDTINYLEYKIIYHSKWQWYSKYMQTRKLDWISLSIETTNISAKRLDCNQNSSLIVIMKRSKLNVVDELEGKPKNNFYQNISSWSSTNPSYFPWASTRHSSKFENRQRDGDKNVLPFFIWFTVMD